MAEFLVYERVPFEAIIGLAVRTRAMQARVEECLDAIDDPPPVRVRAHWYF